MHQQPTEPQTVPKQRLRCTFVARLRDHTRFDDVDALVQRIRQDCAETRTVLGI